MPNEHESKIRDLRNGGWYWISKKVLRLYSRTLKTSGIVVYNALTSFANSSTQTCFPTQEYIAKLIGVSRRTVNRKIGLLRGLRLVKVKKLKGRCFYSLLKPYMPNGIQGCDKRDTQDVTLGNTNKNNITRINNNNIDRKNISGTNLKTSKDFKPKTREELLALDIARGLNDLKSLALYFNYSKKYPESFLRKILGEVKEIPFKKIKKGRGALFNYLVKKHAQETSKNHRD